ncbi:MAG: hypothetical protein DMD48_06345 [Gemmatimonadetes bacterium]|nr:MAG: hypothetical protein DMD48_06345 [Gemmatimonadota bacterium]
MRGRSRRYERRSSHRAHHGGRGSAVTYEGPERRRVSSPVRVRRRTVTREVLKHVKGIELRARNLVNTLFTGEYRSVFRGQGIEFAEVRAYQQGDDFRAIDWNVSARMGHPFVKTAWGRCSSPTHPSTWCGPPRDGPMRCASSATL